MTMRRLLSVFVLVALSVAGLAGPASAKPYGPRTGAATVNKTVVQQGGYVRVSGDGFCANTVVRVTVTVEGKRYVSKSMIYSNGSGVASTRVRLTELGTNIISLSGCRAAGGRQVLSASVRVVHRVWQGDARVDDDSVRKGDSVTVRGAGFCYDSRVVLKVYDDGQRYERGVDRAYVYDNRRHGATLKLTRVGRTTITLSGCRGKGGRQILSTTVRVRAAKSFTASPTAFASDMASRVPAVGYAATAGGLLVLFLGVQVALSRRRRTSPR